nr:hypothetical protein CFP56_61975 [Quercus suber]
MSKGCSAMANGSCGQRIDVFLSTFLLEELHLPQRQLVILPNHIHVLESEGIKLSFGSFGADFGVTTGYVSGPMSDKSSTSLSEISQGIEESMAEQASRHVFLSIFLLEELHLPQR